MFSAVSYVVICLDPCQPQHRMAWGRYKPEDSLDHHYWLTLAVVVLSTIVKKLASEGGTCWYCFRDWAIIYSGRWTLSVYKKKVLEDDDLEQKRIKYSQWLVQKVLAFIEIHGSRDNFAEITWPSEVEIETTELVEIVWEPPKEEHLPLSAYATKHGPDEETYTKHMNDVGDRLALGPDGVSFNMVLLNTSNGLWTKSTRMVQQSSKRQKLGGTDKLAQETTDDRFQQLVAGMTGASASSLTLLPTGASAAAAPSLSTASPSKPPPTPSAASPVVAAAVAASKASSQQAVQVDAPAPKQKAGRKGAPAGNAKAKGKASAADGKTKGRPPQGGAYMLDLGLEAFVFFT